MPHYELVGCFDQNVQLCKQYALQYGILAYETLEELFKNVEVVTIAAPSALHHKLAIAAAQCGCHVLVEKPLALTPEDAQEIIDACEAAGVRLCVGHVERFNPAITSLMSIIESEELISVDFKRMSPFQARIADASVVMDLMIHDVDVINSICNEPIKHLSAQGARVFTDKIDFAQALITYESGRLASLTASRVTETKIRNAQINTKRAFIDVDYLARTVEISRKTHFSLDIGYQMQYTQENIIEKVFVPMEEPLRAEFEHFAHAIMSETSIGPSGIMGKKALELCCLIEQRILEGLAQD
jgi:predicted dehydrogenase